MEIEKAFKIAEREWENIRVSLKMCADIGEFISDNEARNKPSLHLVSQGLLLVKNLFEMDKKLPTYGYFSPEAAYVFATLASKAGKRLGLFCNLAQTFGSGYSWVRTGWFDLSGIENQQLINQSFFIKIFFPLGGYFNWDFNSPVIKTKLKIMLSKFALWQENPSIYIQDVMYYREQLEPLWRGLTFSPASSIDDIIEDCKTWEEIKPRI